MRRTKNRGAEPGQAVPALGEDNSCKHFPLPWGTRWFWKRSGAVWSGLGLYGAVWGCSGLYGVVWGCLGLYGVVWGCVGSFAHLWE